MRSGQTAKYGRRQGQKGREKKEEAIMHLPPGWDSGTDATGRTYCECFVRAGVLSSLQKIITRSRGKCCVHSLYYYCCLVTRLLFCGIQDIGGEVRDD